MRLCTRAALLGVVMLLVAGCTATRESEPTGDSGQQTGDPDVGPPRQWGPLPEMVSDVSTPAAITVERWFPALISAAGVPHVAIDKVTGGLWGTEMYRYVGGTWEWIPAPLRQNVQYQRPALAADAAGRLYLIGPSLWQREPSATEWQAATLSANDQAIIAGFGEFNSLSWYNTSLVLAGGSNLTELTVYAYLPGGQGDTLFPLGGSLLQSAGALVSEVSLVGYGATVYATWREGSGSGDCVYVAQYSAGSWSVLGGGPVSDPTHHARQPRLLLADAPYLGYREYFTNGSGHDEYQLVVKRYDSAGSTWTPLGGSLAQSPTEQSWMGSLAFLQSKLYAAVTEAEGTSMHLRVLRYDTDVGWTKVACDDEALEYDDDAEPTEPLLQSYEDGLVLVWMEKHASPAGTPVFWVFSRLHRPGVVICE